MTPLDVVSNPAMIAGLFAGLAGCTVCLILLRKRRLDTERRHAELRSELQAIVRAQQAECSAEIGQIGRNVALLESSAQTIETTTAGLTRSMRAEAMRLLRSGASPESIGPKLGIGRREMRLIAQISRTLSLELDPFLGRSAK